jgi:3-hydroxyacyl-[acyl-carrier-protein] dehydratase
MSIAPSQSSSEVGRGSAGEPEKLRIGLQPLIDLSQIDLGARRYSKADIEKLNPHRDPMSLLDWVVWTSPSFHHGVGLKHIRDTEFWVPGHFPGAPMFPGVLMIEAGAQLACFLYNNRVPGDKLAAFLRIENASFRSMVQPGDDLYLLCTEVKFSSRRFISDVQGIVGDKIAFDARISGMHLQ